MRLHRPSHATVVAYLALFVAMSGTAAAATGNVFILGQDNRADHASVLANKSGTTSRAAGQVGQGATNGSTLRSGSGTSTLICSIGWTPPPSCARPRRRLTPTFSNGHDGTHFMATLCPDASVALQPQVSAGCSQLTMVSGPMQVSPSWIPSVSGRLLLCHEGQVVSGGLHARRRDREGPDERTVGPPLHQRGLVRRALSRSLTGFDRAQHGVGLVSGTGHRQRPGLPTGMMKAARLPPRSWRKDQERGGLAPAETRAPPASPRRTMPGLR
jgi:hypothetical protein